jgi:hypothetical protein
MFAIRSAAWAVLPLFVSACVSQPASRFLDGGEVRLVDAGTSLDAGQGGADGGFSACETPSPPIPFCPVVCDDGDPCTTDSCSVSTGFACLHRPACPGDLCVDGQCVSESCTSRLEIFGACALDDGQQCRRLLADGGTATVSGPAGTSRAECTPEEECTLEGKICAVAPDRTLIVWPFDAGVPLLDGGLPVEVAVYGVRRGDDTSFQLRPGVAALQLLGLRPATRLIFPSGFQWNPGWGYVVDRQGDVVQHVEVQGSPGWACELFDCTRPTPWPRRTGPGPTWVRQPSSGEARFGRARARHEASGDYTVHVFTFYEGEAPQWSSGRLLGSLPGGCDPVVDAVRDSWNLWARQWTNGAISLHLSFVDQGVIPLPDDETLGRVGQPTVPTDPFRNAQGLMEFAARQLPLRGERDLILVSFVGVDGQAGGGMAFPEKGVALVRVPRQRVGFSAFVTLHELGHLFGAVDLYDGRSSTGCAPEVSDEFSPDLYCWASGVSRLNARELGWLLPDGGAASTVTHVCQSPSSFFGCDPD